MTDESSHAHIHVTFYHYTCTIAISNLTLLQSRLTQIELHNISPKERSISEEKG